MGFDRKAPPSALVATRQDGAGGSSQDLAYVFTPVPVTGPDNRLRWGSATLILAKGPTKSGCKKLGWFKKSIRCGWVDEKKVPTSVTYDDEGATRSQARCNERTWCGCCERHWCEMYVGLGERFVVQLVKLCLTPPLNSDEPPVEIEQHVREHMLPHYDAFIANTSGGASEASGELDGESSGGAPESQLWTLGLKNALAEGETDEAKIQRLQQENHHLKRKLSEAMGAFALKNDQLREIMRLKDVDQVPEVAGAPRRLASSSSSEDEDE